MNDDWIRHFITDWDIDGWKAYLFMLAGMVLLGFMKTVKVMSHKPDDPNKKSLMV